MKLDAGFEFADRKETRKIGSQQHVLTPGPEDGNHGIQHRIVVMFTDVIAEKIIDIYENSPYYRCYRPRRFVLG